MSKWVVEADGGRMRGQLRLGPRLFSMCFIPVATHGWCKTCALKHVPAMHARPCLEMSMLLPAALTPPASVSAVRPRYVHGRTAGEVLPGHGWRGASPA